MILTKQYFYGLILKYALKLNPFFGLYVESKMDLNTFNGL